MDVSCRDKLDAIKLPQPMVTSLESTVSPIHHLLLSYPIPELVVPTLIGSMPSSIDEQHQDNTHNHEEHLGVGLQTRSALSEAAVMPGTSGNKEDLWNMTEVRFLSQIMQASITDLLHDGQCTRFLQEELHSECCAAAPSTSVAATAAAPRQEDKSTDCISTAAAASYLSKQATESLMIQLSSAPCRPSTISRPASIKKTQSGCWTSDYRMTLRPRKPSFSPQQQQQPQEEASPEVKPPVQSSTRANSPSPEPFPPPTLPTTIASKNSLAEMLESMDALSEDAAKFMGFAHAPALPPDLFKEVSTAKLSGLVSALVVDGETEEAGGGEGVMEAKEKLSPGQKDWLRTARALCCITLISSPVFDVNLIPDGTIEQLINTFASVVRYVTAELSCLTPEKDAYESKTTRARGAKGSAVGMNIRPISQDAPNEPNACSRHQFTPSKTILRWVEALRLFLQRLAPIVCNRTLNLISDSELIRLEDLVHHVLFVAPHRSATKDAYLWYASYISDRALHAYRCLWNRLEVQRTVTANRFFPRLLLSNYLTLRVRTGEDGIKLLPLTVAMLSAAQSVPMDTDATGSDQAVCLQNQCELWVDCLLRQLILEHENDEKTHQAIPWNILTLLLEDLVGLVGSPNWPIADMLLRACVLSLIKTFLENNARHQSGKPIKGASAMNVAHATAAIDVIAEVTLKLFHPTISGLTPMAQFPKLHEGEVLNARMNEALLTYWADATKRNAAERSPAPTRNHSGQTQSKRGSRSRKKGKANELEAEKCNAANHNSQNLEPTVGREENGVRSVTDSIRRFLYYALSHYAETTLAVDEASLWTHVRAAQVLCWHLSDPALLPESALDALIQARAVPCAGIRVEWAELHAWGRTLCTQEGESMLSTKSRLMLVSVLLNTLFVKDEHGQEALITSDAVAKKSLQHLSRIAEICPSVCRLVWPIARRCLRDNCARVRELGVSLLMTLLKSALMASGGASALPVEEASLATDAVTLLIPLLEDKSVTVVSRAIAALETALTNHLYDSLLESAPGKELLGFIQHKLLVKAKDARHAAEITKLFYRRWMIDSVESEDDIVSTTMRMMPHIRLTTELLALVLRGGAVEYPYEVPDDHPLINLLRGLKRLAATTPLLEPVEIAEIAKHQSKRVGVDMQHTMRSVARSLWAQQQSAGTAEESVRCMAALCVLAVVASEWVEPLMDAVVAGLECPSTTTPLFSQDSESKRGKEWVGGVLLQTCQIAKAVLSSTKVPTISFEHLARSLTKLLSKYVGPYQQRIIASSCGALASMITCGTKHKLSPHINQTYLRICYSLMNLYYVRVKGLLPELTRQPQNIAYIQRFLFLISELLRSYPGWRTPPPVLLQDTACDAVPNWLAKGAGICENIFELVEDVRAQCGAANRPRINVIALRALASLCMLRPVDFLYRCEACLAAALADAADVAHQTQGLTFILDFLTDEDARIDLAARVATTSSPDVAVLSDQESVNSDEGRAQGKSRSHSRIRGIKRTRPAVTTADNALSLPEQSSGMAMWVMQRFHELILQCCRSPHVAVRKLCLDILQLTAQGGLLPPVKYLHAVVALAADVDSNLRQRAGQFLFTRRDQNEDVITSLASRGIELTYEVHHLCEANLIQSAILSGGGPAAGQSVHAPLFALLHKASRDGLIVSLLRYFYNEATAKAWIRGHDSRVWEKSIGDGFRVANPVTFLGHLAVVIVTLPFNAESDVLHLVQRCRTGIDLYGETSLDQITSLLINYQEVESRKVRAGGVVQPLMDIVSFWKCVGVMLLVYIHRAMRTEYRLKTSKPHNSALQGNLLYTSSHSHEHQSKTTASFLPSVVALVRHASVLLCLCSGPDDVNKHNGGAINGNTLKEGEGVVLGALLSDTEEALVFLRQELENGLLEEGIGGVERRGSTTKAAGTNQRCSRKRVRAAAGTCKQRKSRRKNSSSTHSEFSDSSLSTPSSSLVSEEDDDATEEEGINTSSSSVSTSTTAESDTE